MDFKTPGKHLLHLLKSVLLHSLSLFYCVHTTEVHQIPIHSFASVSWCTSRPAVEAVWSRSPTGCSNLLLAAPHPTAHCFSWLLCSSWGLQWQLWAYLLSQAKPAPKPGPGAEHLLPILTPKGTCQCFLGRARLGELCALELQHRAVAGLISLWNSTETKGLSAVRRKACRRAVRTGILRTTHEWKKENGNLFNEPLCFVI